MNLDHLVSQLKLEQLAVYGFACVVAWKLLSFFLNQFSSKLDCIKDTLIQLVAEVKEIKSKLKVEE
jgi:hypothetical protein